MDFSKFMDDNFDVKDWVNTAFRSHKEGSKDQYATTLVMKLQMFIQEVNNIIEETCQQSVQNLPRVVRELEAVRQEAGLLRDQMTMVRQDIQKVEQDTAQSMQMLLKLDTIKTRMKAASDALREADNWTTLSADVEEVFESGDINAISQKLVGMQQSLQMLSDVPDYTERCQFLETLKNRLEATVSPQLVAAFNSQSQDSARTYVQIFTDIDRLPQLYKYYHKCHKNELTQSWREIQEKRSDDSLMEWVNDYYDTLLQTWHSQIQWCSGLFDDPAPVVVELLTESLLGLDPTLAGCIETHLRVQPDPLQALTHLKQSSERFAKSIEAAVDSYFTGKIAPGYSECLEKLSAAIYAPYKPYIQQYGQYEQAALTKALDNIPLDHEEVLDCVRLLGESVTLMFSAANLADERCIQFTNGCGYVPLIDALKKYFSDYVKEFRRVVTNLREKCKTNTSTVESEDWEWFQHSLRIIQTTGELLMHTDELDQTLVMNIINTVGHFGQQQAGSPLREPHSPRSSDPKKKNPFHDYSILLIASEADRTTLSQLYSNLEQGDTPSVLDEVRQAMCQLSETVHRFAFDIVFAPLQDQLNQVPTMEIWTSQSAGGALTSDLPNFSLSPQEYITKVGQYLLTLPQQLEPFTMQDNPALTTSLKYGKLPYTSQQDEAEQLADLWLDSVACGTMHVYGEQVLKIHQLTPMATRQLVTDIDYLTNVLDDLGLQSSEAMTALATLLQTSQDSYSEAAENKPQRLASAVAAMRGLTLD